MITQQTSQLGDSLDIKEAVRLACFGNSLCLPWDSDYKKIPTFSETIGRCPAFDIVTTPDTSAALWEFQLCQQMHGVQ